MTNKFLSVFAAVLIAVGAVFAPVQDAASLGTNAYAEKTEVSAPKANRSSGTFIVKGSVEVKLTCKTEGADIYYSLNGADYKRYTGSITISKSSVLNVYAKADGVKSKTVTYVYKLSPKINVSLKEGEYGAPQKVKLSSPVSGVDYYYTLDGSIPTEKSRLYDSEGITIEKTSVLTLMSVKNGWEPRYVTKQYVIKNSGSAGSASSKEAVLVAKALDENPTDYKITSDSVYVQDLMDFCGGRLSYDEMSGSGGHNVRDFEGVASDLEVIEAYVNALCDGKHNLKLTKTYLKEIGDCTFFSYGIDYTGTASVKYTCDVTYTDEECNILVYGMIEKNKLTAAVWVPENMELVDLGQRFGKPDAATGTNAKSAATGLYQLPDGSFQTEDGRLTVKLGQATVLRDGKSYTCEAAINKDKDGTRDELWIRGDYADETIAFFTPANSVKTGSIFTYKNLMREESYVNSTPLYLKTENDLTGRNWTLCFGLCHDGDWILPLSGKYNQFEDLYIRVMYYKPKEAAVYYIYSEFDSEPNTVEALCAVNLRNTTQTADVDGEFTMYVGESLSIDCGREFGSTSNLYNWEITEGASLASISGTKSQSCTITAKKEGTVRVKVSYEYGIKEPDVLTGILITTHKTKTFEYVITIKKK